MDLSQLRLGRLYVVKEDLSNLLNGKSLLEGILPTDLLCEQLTNDTNTHSLRHRWFEPS